MDRKSQMRTAIPFGKTGRCRLYETRPNHREFGTFANKHKIPCASNSTAFTLSKKCGPRVIYFFYQILNHLLIQKRIHINIELQTFYLTKGLTTINVFSRKRLFYIDEYPNRPGSDHGNSNGVQEGAGYREMF